jgi:hypothetical protein
MAAGQARVGRECEACGAAAATAWRV